MSHSALITSEVAAPIANVKRTRLKSLSLTDFRSYASAQVEFDGRPVAIAGENGSGKTNILEALSLVGPGRGLRSAKLQELPRRDGPGGWAVSLRVSDTEEECRFGVGAAVSKPDRRVCRIDNESASGPGVFSRHLRFMWLTPAQDRLFMEGPGERRRFLDRMTFARLEGHAKTASEYEKAMRQRQRLLEGPDPDDKWLCALEEQMASSGIAISQARNATVSALEKNAVTQTGAPFPAADIELQGEFESIVEVEDAEQAELQFVERLRTCRRRDAEAGRALFGPHKSDLVVRHRDKGQLARLCSTGEQKALLIGLVLGNARGLTMSADFESSTAPLILLLDEIAAHLDAARRAALFDIIEGLNIQTFMTGTDKSLFDAWGARAQFFETANGALRDSVLT